jgi:hypothetical protein
MAPAADLQNAKPRSITLNRALQFAKIIAFCDVQNGHHQR